MKNDDKIKAIIESLRDNALEDIKRASQGGAKMGAFILSSCLIDAIAGFMKGCDTEKDDYKCVVSKYMPDYNVDDIYKDLRCKLVHSYSEGGSYSFTDNNPSLHLTKQEDGKTIVNLENFVSEIEDALTHYSAELLNKANTSLRKMAIKRFDSNGIIQVQRLLTSDIQATTSLTPALSGSDQTKNYF
jgi:hypothetical protein